MGREENPVVEACLRLAAIYGLIVWRQNQGRIPGRAFRGKKGLGDISGYSPRARIVNIEVKRPGGGRRKDQEELVADIHKRGGIAVVVESSAELHQYLEARLLEWGEL